MDNIRSVLDYIRNFFSAQLDVPRKRRAAPDVIHEFSLTPNSKYRKTQFSMSRDPDDDWFARSNVSFRRSPLQKISPRAPTRQPRVLETVVLNDDDVIEIKKPTDFKFKNTSKVKYTSTPSENRIRGFVNGNGIHNDDDDDVAFVKEIKSPKEKQEEAKKIGFNYIKPLSGNLFTIGTSTQNRRKHREKHPTGLRNKFSSGLNYSIRLDDKIKYKKLLESASNSSANDSSLFHTPVGKLFDYDSANRSSRILNMAMSPSFSRQGSLNSSKERLSTKDTIKKVLDEFVIKDSDSEEDVLLVNPPSPKPDIEVDPVNSLKKVIDTSETTKSDWLTDVMVRHRQFIDKRQKEIEILRECADKHSVINKDMTVEMLRDKVNRCCQIKDAVIPIVEEEEVELPPLTEEHRKMVNRAFRGDPNEVLARKFNLNITRRDLQTLAGLNWLNDEVINFYMNMIIERGKEPKWPNSYAFNTFFYSKLVKDGPQSLRRWTKRVDIFSHDLICIPIHLGMHWCLAVVDFREKTIKYYDSMGSPNNRCLEVIRNYLEAEHMDKKKEVYDTSDFVLENVKDIPQQMNGSDCGMFSCTFAEFLTRNAKITFSQKDMPYLRKKMVVEIISGELLIK